MINLKEELSKYDKVYIQTHDNPDCDAIACAYGIYSLCKEVGIDTEVVYFGGLIKKPNIACFSKYINMPLTFKKNIVGGDNDLLMTVDCQYGRKNVTNLDFKNVLCIDHHKQDNVEQYDEMLNINVKYHIDDTKVSCSTIVYELLVHTGMNMSKMLCTALYYGLLTDSLNFTEKMSKPDKDFKLLLEEKGLIDYDMIEVFKNSIISLEDLAITQRAIAGLTTDPMLKEVAIVRTEECDQNLLGYISDMVLEVEGIGIVISFYETNKGYKLSVRSSPNKRTAYEIAKILTRGIGDGGGHPNKSGGFIDKELFQLRHSNDTIISYINRTLLQCLETV